MSVKSELKAKISYKAVIFSYNELTHPFPDQHDSWLTDNDPKSTSLNERNPKFYDIFLLMFILYCFTYDIQHWSRYDLQYKTFYKMKLVENCCKVLHIGSRVQLVDITFHITNW